jgi:hypothetical protein
MRKIFGLVLASALAACSLSTGSDGVLARFETLPAGGVQDPPIVTAAPVNGTIVVNGTASTACASYGLRADATRSGSDVVLRIRWRRSDVCATLIGGFSYQAALGDLPSGTYHLTVVQPVYQAPAGWPETTVLGKDIVVQ